jgi:hypothetical protein
MFDATNESNDLFQDFCHDLHMPSNFEVENLSLFANLLPLSPLILLTIPVADNCIEIATVAMSTESLLILHTLITTDEDGPEDLIFDFQGGSLQCSDPDAVGFMQDCSVKIREYLWHKACWKTVDMALQRRMPTLLPHQSKALHDNRLLRREETRERLVGYLSRYHLNLPMRIFDARIISRPLKPTLSDTPMSPDCHSTAGGSEHEDPVCAVCLHALEPTDLFVVDLCCGIDNVHTHSFHEDCILVWLQKSLTCPLCKFDFSQQ